jgi:hypothetical protein
MTVRKPLISPEQEAEAQARLAAREETDADWLRRGAIMFIDQVWVRAYTDGELSVEDCLRHIKDALDALEKKLAALGQVNRLALSNALGYFTWQVLEAKPPEGVRRQMVPTAFKAFVPVAVELCAERGFAKTKTADYNAYDAAAHFLLNECGIRGATRGRVEHWLRKGRVS